MVLARCIVYTDAMDMKITPTADLLDELDRLTVAQYFASNCDDRDWSSRLAHSIDIIEAELNRREGETR